MSEYDKIAPAIVKCASALRPATKGGNNTYDKYRYAKVEDYIKACSDAMIANGLTMTYSVEEALDLPDLATQGGKTERFVRVILQWRIIHESGQSINGQSVGDGADRRDKAVYKATTGARKYAIAMALNMVTTDNEPEDDAGHDEDPPAPILTVASSLPPPAAPSARTHLVEAVEKWTAFPHDCQDFKDAMNSIKRAMGGTPTAEEALAWVKERRDAKIDFLKAVSG